MTSLPVLGAADSCDGCSACCDHLSTPPFWGGEEELARVPEAMMAEVRRVRAERVRQDGDGLGCMWLDRDARRCRHYDFRPDACREFAVGGEDCVRIRLEALRDAWRDAVEWAEQNGWPAVLPEQL